MFRLCFIVCLLHQGLASSIRSIEDDEPIFSRIPDVHDLGYEIVDGDIAVHIQDPLQRKGSGQAGSKWPDKTIKYAFHKSVNETNQKLVVEAIDEWMANTCLTFVDVSKKSALDKIRDHHITVRADKRGCWTMIGYNRVGGGVMSVIQNTIDLTSHQDLNLETSQDRALCMTKGTALHELGHSIGFYHEQSRSDRDGYLRVLFENMSPDKSMQFEKMNDVNHSVEFDYNSIMQYPEYAFSDDVFEKNTIIAKDIFQQHKLGGTELTFRDKKLANLIYKCDEGCANKNDLSCENGGYMFNTFGQTGECKCVCPPNFKGDKCETPLEREYYERLTCGGNVTTEGTIQTTNYPSTTKDDGSCIFWIQAPEGKVVEATFTDFQYMPKVSRKDYYGSTASKCRDDKVEVRLKDIYVGKMYCGEDLKNQTLVSSQENMVVLARPMHKNSTGGFQADVKFIDPPKGSSSPAQRPCTGALSSILPCMSNYISLSSIFSPNL